MKLKDSVVSVLLPVYNAGKYLPECLESLKEQSYDNLQIIAIDDKSKDNSFAILKKFQKKYKNLEVYSNKKHYGLAVCYNRMLRVAKGRFIAFANPNDINAVHRFKRQINFLLKNPRTVAIGTQYTVIDEQMKKLDRSELPQDHEVIYNTLLQNNSLHPETVMVDRTLLPKDLLYFKTNKYPLIFAEVFIKFFQYGQVANLTHSLYFQRTNIKRLGRKASRFKHMASLLKLVVSSRSNHDYRPPLRSLFSPLVKGA